MNRTVQFIIFACIFFSIYLSMHYYIYYRITQLFSIKRSLLLLTVVICLSLSFPLFSILEHFISMFLTRFLYTIAAVWLGVLFFFFSTLVIYEVMKYIIKLDNRLYGLIIISAVIALTITSLVCGFFIVVRDVEIPIEGLEEEISIVQLSDMHIGTLRNSGFTKNVADKTNELNPDLVVITGDFIDGGGIIHKGIYDALNSLKAPTYFITGNHEVYSGLNETKKIIDNTKVIFLDNEAVVINGLQIIGVSDPGNQNGHISIKDIDFEKGIPTVLLRHQPALAEEAGTEGISLQISGHTHNGQIFPFNFFVRLFWKYTKGLYKINGMYLYVSPGTGTWGPPMRFGSINEITHFHLTPLK